MEKPELSGELLNLLIQLKPSIQQIAIMENCRMKEHTAPSSSLVFSTELAVSVIDLVPEIPDNLLESAAEDVDFARSLELDCECRVGERPRSTGVLA